MDKIKVLIVDDEKDFLKLVKLNLEITGKYELLVLSNAKEIISELRSFKPNIILLDLLMPGIGGIEAFDMLNNDPVGKDIPIIIISALDKDTDKLTAYKKGVVKYISKPIDANVLMLEIEEALRCK